jgi:glycosyltransferase involved in cell wall biosynthesis
VNEYGLRIARAAGAPVVHLPGLDELDAAIDHLDAAAVHLHFTDHLWGKTPPDAARRVARLASGRRMTVTFHDVPQESDGKNRAAREAAYAAVAQHAARVVVSSEHERSLLVPVVGATPVVVVPLPVDLAPVPHPHPAGDGQVTISGFIYPGKGHAEAIDALRALPPEVNLVALGAVSAGCDWLVDDLRERARAIGRTVTITGFIDENRWLARLQAAGIPLAAHTHVSASGSIASWIGAGRRPLVVDSRYARELEGRAPGAITIYQPDALPAALLAALADPESTWRLPHLRIPGTPEAASAYVAAWAAA